MVDEHEIIEPATPRVRRIRRRRKRSLKSRIRRALKGSGMDKRIYIMLAGIVGVVAGVYLYDLLFAVFPVKMK